MSTTKVRPEKRVRIASDDRRSQLLDAAAAMVAHGAIDAVTMDTVAVAAGVSRALLYKHFENREELLTALYARESARLHAQLSRAVSNEKTLAGMLRALVLGVVAAQTEQAVTLAALQAEEARGPEQRVVQTDRDRVTLRYFTAQAVEEFAVTSEVARDVLAIGLGSIPAVLRRWRTRPTDDHAERLADAYVAMVLGGLDRAKKSE
jgi:AcrR family transcriptional regulator